MSYRSHPGMSSPPDEQRNFSSDDGSLLNEPSSEGLDMTSFDEGALDQLKQALIRFSSMQLDLASVTDLDYLDAVIHDIIDKADQVESGRGVGRPQYIITTPPSDQERWRSRILNMHDEEKAELAKIFREMKSAAGKAFNKDLFEEILDDLAEIEKLTVQFSRMVATVGGSEITEHLLRT